jgi:aryl-alcohol dehydrogenase-like predicted oxidoreductase
MQKRTLGRTGVEVSRISLGTVEIGMDYGIGPDGTAGRPSEAEAGRLLHAALDLGINLIDTARAYGESEAIIGRTLKARRREFILCSKVSSFHGQSPATGELRSKIMASIHESLRLLQTDVIDLMQLHCAVAEVKVADEVISILHDARENGEIRWLGASVYGEEAAYQALQSGAFDCVQVACSMLDRRLERRFLSEAAVRNLGVVARSVLLKGALTGRYRHLPEPMAPLRECVERLDAVAIRHGMSLPEMAYRYVGTREMPQTALVGASSVEEVECAVRFAAAGPLPDEAVQAIHEVSIADERWLNPGAWPLG